MAHKATAGGPFLDRGRVRTRLLDRPEFRRAILVRGLSTNRTAAAFVADGIGVVLGSMRRQDSGRAGLVTPPLPSNTTPNHRAALGGWRVSPRVRCKLVMSQCASGPRARGAPSRPLPTSALMKAESSLGDHVHCWLPRVGWLPPEAPHLLSKAREHAHTRGYKARQSPAAATAKSPRHRRARCLPVANRRAPRQT